MLPQVYDQHYQKLQQTLEQLQGHVAQVSPEGTDLRSELMSEFLKIQNFFQLQVANLNPDLLSLEMQSKVGSYQTEINKQLRLLGTDLMFLKSARQASTAEQRRTQIRDRLEALIGYCKVLLQNL
jgi:hypothetical protein